MNHPDRCANCTTRPTCWINGICVIKRDSAKVEAQTPAADAQDSSYRADKLEISRLYSKLAVQSKLTRDAESALTDVRQMLDALRIKYKAQQAEAAKPFKLEDNEQYRLQMAAICTAALGYWREGDSIHPDYDTPGLRDVAIRYDAYDKLYKERDRLAAELTAANDSLIAAREQIAALVADQRESDADRARELREYVTTRQFHQQQASMAPETVHARLERAERALLRSGFQDLGGQEWKPPLGKPPVFVSALAPATGAVLEEFYDKYCLGQPHLIACAEAAFYAFNKAMAPNIGIAAPSRGVSIPAAELDVTEQEDEEAFARPSSAEVQRAVDRLNALPSTPARTSDQIRIADLEQRMERAENAYLLLQCRVNTHHDRLDGLKGI